jgi:tetratricopeptide (TPR) repeat protein
MQVRNPQFRSQVLTYAGLALVTLALYQPTLQHAFIEYDDQQYVTDNPRVQAGLTWAGFIWAFGFHAGNWHPLAWLSHMLDCQLFGARAGGHHLTSVLLHTATTLMLFAVLQRLTGLRANVTTNPTSSLWRSAAVAALFAWHPLHVESVAWVAERKDVLCAFFWMVTLWFYLRYVEKPSRPRYLTVVGAFALCLMAKPMGVTLPFVLLLLDFWPLQRFSVPGFRLRVWLEKVPLLVMSTAACALTMSAQELAVVSKAGLPIGQRLVHTVVAYDHYFWAMFLPRNLAVYYPYQLNLPTPTVVASAIVLILVTALALKNIRQRPYLLMGWLWFLGTLVPVIGLVQVGDQAWADRYTYLPLVGLFVAVVWLTFELIKSRVVLKILSLGIAVVMLVTAAHQIAQWQDTRTLFAHANRVTPENYMAVTVLGSELAKAGKLHEAIEYYQTALRFKPGFPEAHFFLGNALDEQGKLAEAVAEYEKALWFRPTQEQTHIFMGIALGKQKKYDEAIQHYEAALKLNFDSAVAHNNLARIYHTLGRLNDAIDHYETALEIDPKLALAHNNLGILQLQQGKLADGTRHLREALRLKPENLETQFNLALALNQAGQWQEAVYLFQRVMLAQAANPKAHAELALALTRLHRSREAMSEYAAALLLQPDFLTALDGLAWILATDSDAACRNGNEAVSLAEHACNLTGQDDPVKLRTLAAAYAEAGRFTEALTTLQQAQAQATQQKLSPLLNDLSAMQTAFQAGKPWRD